MTIWGRVKNEVDIRDVYPKTLNSRGRGECMLHENTSSPSFQVYPGNTWTCFSCKHTGEEIKGGDVIDCYAHLHRKSRIEAVRELAEQYGINPGDYDPEEYREYLDNLHTQKQVFRIFARLCYDELLSSEHYDRIKRERGFTEETIEEFKIGLFNNNVRNRMQSDFGDLELIKYGFKTISEDNGRGNWIMGNRIVYPYLDNNQDPVYFIYRRIESDVDFRENAKYIKHPVKNTIENVLFGYFTHEQRNKPLVITEGITDAISVFQANFPCLSPVTTSFKEDDIEKMVRYAHGWSKIVVINDNEESEHGLRGAEKTILALLEHDL
ncbi:MAG: CHC2 zinc finger domain-containing protein, partial [Promethearchaeota archaeon]